MNGPEAELVHALPGRVRVRARAIVGRLDACKRIARELGEDEAYDRVSVRPRTGSIVVETSNGPLDPEAVRRAIVSLVAALPRAPAPAREPPGPTRIARAMAHAASEANHAVADALDHRADLGTLLPMAFAALGLLEVASTGKMPAPSWFNLVWWSIRSFMTFNEDAVLAETDSSRAGPVS